MARWRSQHPRDRFFIVVVEESAALRKLQRRAESDSTRAKRSPFTFGLRLSSTITEKEISPPLCSFLRRLRAWGWGFDSIGDYC